MVFMKFDGVGVGGVEWFVIFLPFVFLMIAVCFYLGSRRGIDLGVQNGPLPESFFSSLNM